MRFGRYILQRAVIAALLIVGTSLVLFLLMRLLPGDPARVILGLRYTPEAAEQINERLGLNLPVAQQYLLWMGNALRGDLGQDFRNNRPINEILRQRLPVTMELAFLAMLMAVALALTLGLLAEIVPRTFLKRLGDGFSALGLSIPDFWLGIMLILFFAETLRWLPSSGYVSPGEDLVQNLRRMLLPSVTLAVGLAAVLLRFVQTGLEAVMAEDYIRAARSRGVGRVGLVLKHALKNASLPIVTVIGLQFGYLLGGAVIVEEVFSLPGVGRLVVAAVMERNYPVAQAAILVVVTLFILINLAVDILYGLLDPRIQARG